ncbi:MAG: hypothetical protein ACLVJ6_17330 [Merdibacter sp.]
MSGALGIGYEKLYGWAIGVYSIADRAMSCRRWSRRRQSCRHYSHRFPAA